MYTLNWIGKLGMQKSKFENIMKQLGVNHASYSCNGLKFDTTKDETPQTFLGINQCWPNINFFETNLVIIYKCFHKFKTHGN